MNFQRQQPWPPQYTIRKSKRARRISLKISDARGLEIVLPLGVSEGKIPGLLEEHQAWIIKQLAKRPVVEAQSMPDHLALLAIDQTWRIFHQSYQSEFIRLYPKRNELTLLLQGPLDAVDQFRQLIKKWLMRQAKIHLSAMIDRLCAVHGFEYNRLSIRAAKTRWGSCTVKKNISLNYKLLLMPKAYAEHIILHELCHTHHMDHSDRFWALLRSVDPHCDLLCKKTRDYKNALTLWLDAR